MPYPRRISGGALDIGAAQFSHLVRNLDTNSGLCLLIFKVVRLELWTNNRFPTTYLCLDRATKIMKDTFRGHTEITPQVTLG